MLEWLRDESSLTHRLVCACAGAFQVRPLVTQWRRPALTDARPLGIAEGELAFIRQVHLLCDGRPWVFAHTVIPRKVAQGTLRGLTRLGSKPLGAVLFSDPGMHRGPIEVARLEPGMAMYRLAMTGQDEKRPIWGRRSVFRLHEQALLVSEIFLTELNNVSI